MNKFLKRIRRKIHLFSDGKSLKQFVENIYWGDDLDVATAKKNLENGTVEIIYPNGQHASNGLLITASGYFITNYHCISNGISNMRIKIFDGRVFDMKYVAAIDRTADIALVKAAISDQREHIVYKFFKDKDLPFGKKLPVVFLSRRNGKLGTKGGFTQGLKYKELPVNGQILSNQLICEIHSVPGDSGSSIVDSNAGAILGFLASGDGQQLTFAACMSDALELIMSYCYKK